LSSSRAREASLAQIAALAHRATFVFSRDRSIRVSSQSLSTIVATFGKSGKA
jgi:hypothetical protein